MMNVNVYAMDGEIDQVPVRSAAVQPQAAAAWKPPQLERYFANGKCS